MKKLLITLMIALTAVAANARDIYSRNVADLPGSAQSTLANNFKAKVSLIKIDKGLTGVSEYEVVLTDGTEITFDRNGAWTDIEVAANKRVPDSFVPKTILEYIKTNDGNKKIVGIEKNRNTYQVSLADGKTLIFDRAGNFQRYD